MYVNATTQRRSNRFFSPYVLNVDPVRVNHGVVFNVRYYDFHFTARLCNLLNGGQPLFLEGCLKEMFRVVWLVPFYPQAELRRCPRCNNQWHLLTNVTKITKKEETVAHNLQFVNIDVEWRAMRWGKFLETSGTWWKYTTAIVRTRKVWLVTKPQQLSSATGLHSVVGNVACTIGNDLYCYMLLSPVKGP